MRNHDNPLDKRVWEAFHDYNPPPPPDAWSKIEAGLKAQRRGRVLLLRRTITSAAAVLLLLIAGTFMFVFKPEVQDNTPPVSIAQRADRSTDRSTDLPTEKISENPVKHSTEQLLHPQKKSQSISHGVKGTVSQRDTSSPEKILILSPAMDLYTYLPETTPFEDDPFLLEMVIDMGYLPVIFPIHNPYLSIAAVDPLPDKEKTRRWIISGIAGQTYANYYNIDNKMASTYKMEHDIVASSQERLLQPRTSSGLAVNYLISNRFGVSTGLSYHQISTPVNAAGSPVITIVMANKPFLSSFGTISFNEEINRGLTKSPMLEFTSGKMEQRFSYLEIPVMATYAILRHRLGLSVKGGVGANLLTENVVLMVDDNVSRKIGSTNEIRNHYLSAIMGLDLHYDLTKGLRVNFSPIYRHGLQPASLSPSTKPMLLSLGIYSGLSIRF